MSIYEPSECPNNGLSLNILMRKCKVLKGLEADEKKYQTQGKLMVEDQYDINLPQKIDDKFIVDVPFKRYLSSRRMFQNHESMKDEKKYFRTYFDLMKISVFHKKIPDLTYTCRDLEKMNHIGTFTPLKLYTKMRIRQAVIKWDTTCAMPANVNRNNVPYKDNMIPITELLVDINAPIESGFRRGFCVMHNEVYEIECNDKCDMTTHEICFVWDAKLHTCVTNKGPTMDPWIGYAAGYFYHVTLIEYIQSFQQQIYWSKDDEHDHERYFMGTGDCKLNENIKEYYPGIPFISIGRIKGYVYLNLLSKIGLPVINKAEVTKELFNALLKDTDYLDYIKNKKRKKDEVDEIMNKRKIQDNGIVINVNSDDDSGMNDDGITENHSNNILQSRLNKFSRIFEV
jgi:hypothetical protein